MANPSTHGKSPPLCYICSAKANCDVRHHHMSAREIRVVQGVDKSDLPYMCITCQKVHSARPETGMNVLISNNQLQNIHTPTDTRNVVRKEPDPFHIE